MEGRHIQYIEHEHYGIYTTRTAPGNEKNNFNKEMLISCHNTLLSKKKLTVNSQWGSFSEIFKNRRYESVSMYECSAEICDANFTREKNKLVQGEHPQLLLQSANSR